MRRYASSGSPNSSHAIIPLYYLVWGLGIRVWGSGFRV